MVWEQHFPGNLAIFLKNAPQDRPGAERTYYALVLVDEETKSSAKGM
jgi:hypothetical protein